MSKVAPTVVKCPRCGHSQSARLFDSLNADRIPAQVEMILAGRFERVECAGCGHAWQPEHTMLFAHFTRRTWIAMHPIADRPHFTVLERGVELVLEQNFRSAPPIVAEGVRGIRPRLVFGHHMLAEAVRMSASSIDPALAECAKLLYLRRHLAEVMRFGPCELAFERFGPGGELVCGVHALPGGARLDELVLPADAIAETRASVDALERQFPDLFRGPYVSATRYLYGAAI
jgi:hypothetical protein